MTAAAALLAALSLGVAPPAADESGAGGSPGSGGVAHAPGPAGPPHEMIPGDYLSMFLMLVGVAFCFVAAIGILRMPDLFTRMQASAKAGTLGVTCLVLASAAHFGSFAVLAEVAVIIAFVFLTTPAAAHLIARAAYFVEVPLWKRTAYDDLDGCYEAGTHVLTAEPAPRRIETAAERSEAAEDGDADDQPARATG